MGNKLMKADFAVAPMYLMRGRNARQQVVILLLWQHTLHGDEWTFASLGKEAGCTVNRAMLDELVEENILAKTPETERKNQKPCQEYYVSADVVPNRVEETPDPPKKKPSMPGWVFAACKIYGAIRGVIPPYRMHNALKIPVSQYGPGVVLDGLERYAKRSDPKFNPTPEKYAAGIVDWIRMGRPETARGVSMLDLVDDSGRQV